MDLLIGQGRVGRLAYFLTGIAVLMPAFFITLATANTNPITGELTLSGEAYLAFVFAGWLQLMNVVRRLRDLGHRWYWLFISLVPFAGWLFSLYLLFAPGIPRAAYVGPRRRGVAPPPPSGQPVMTAEEAHAARNEQYLTDDGSFDMDGLFRDSPVQRD